MIARAVFWASAAAIAAIYLGFPLLTAALARSRKRSRREQSAELPRVTVIIAVHNEQSAIEAKLRNTAELHYPPELIEVVVASDGSTDGTNDLVARFAARPVRLLTLRRGGKNAALNEAIEAAAGDVLVFTDADTVLDRDSIRALVAPFGDPNVGGVLGQIRYTGERSATAGERLYWLLDQLLKRLQARSGSATSASGQLYALRADHAHPIPAGVPDDFFASTGVVVDGARLEVADDAFAYQPIAPDVLTEFQRKTRVITQGLYAVWVRRELLDPRGHGAYALQLLTHKLLRRLVFIPLVGLATSSLVLAGGGPIYLAALVGQALFYTLGVVGIVSARSRFGRLPVLSVPAYFCAVNAACAVAVANVLRGRRIVQWTPERAATQTSAPSSVADDSSQT